MKGGNIMGYSKILFWEVLNFMSIKHGKCEFDDSNIINIKGYNDSGKSAMLTALKVALTNCNPSKHVSFIKDNEDFFRVVVAFDDDIIIMRDKYLNGQSLYEMYRGKELLFTTKTKSGALSRVTEVPQPIADYLGLAIFDSSTCLNARACFEKQLGVQTTGSENYKMLNKILKSEEIASASAMLNNDKNKLVSSINTLESELNVTRNMIGRDTQLTRGLVDAVKAQNEVVKSKSREEDVISDLYIKREAMRGIKIPCELPSIDLSQLSAVQTIWGIKSELDAIPDIPSVKEVSFKQLDALSAMKTISDELKTCKVAPKLPEIASGSFEALLGIKNLYEQYKSISSEVEALDSELSTLNSQLSDYEKELSERGAKMIKCPNCGQLFEGEHSH